jgi:hypothetical protein
MKILSKGQMQKYSFMGKYNELSDIAAHWKTMAKIS